MGFKKLKNVQFKSDISLLNINIVIVLKKCIFDNSDSQASSFPLLPVFMLS